MRWPSWRSREPAAGAGEPEEERQCPALGHHRHLHVELDYVETESASSELWPGLPVEEAVHVEDPAADWASSNGADELTEPVAGLPEGETCSDDESGDDQEGEDGGRRSPGRGRRGRRRGGLPVSTVVGTAAVVLLALLAVVASWRRRLRRRQGA